MEIGYITTRELENSSGRVSGKIRVVVPKGENVVDISLTCPECGAVQSRKEEWKLPFSTNCEKCGFQIRIENLRREIKKKKN